MYLHEWLIFMVNVGEYVSTIDPIWVFLPIIQLVRHMNCL